MSLAPESSSHGRSRSKSPGRRDRDRSPARAPSPNPYGDPKHSYEYAQAAQAKFDYAEPKFDYHSSHGQDSTQRSAGAHYPQPAPTQYTQAAHGGHPSYAQPGSYEHGHISANYAGPQSYYQQAPAQAAKKQGPTYAAAEDHPSYAKPSAYQYAQTEDRAGRPPLSPKADHPSYATFGSPDNDSMTTGGVHSPGPSLSGYTRPNEYSHAPSENHPSYGNPGFYQYAPMDDRRRSPSPKPEHLRHASSHSPANTNLKMGEGHGPTYASPNEYSHGHSEDHPAYANPESYQYAHTEDRTGRPPPSPKPEHARYMTVGSSVGVDMKTGASQPQMPQYAPSPAYTYAQPVAPQPDPARAYQAEGYAMHTAQPAPSGPEYAKPSGYQYAQPGRDITYSKPSVGYAKPEEDIKYKYKDSHSLVEYAQPKEDIKYNYKKPQPSVEYVQPRSEEKHKTQERPEERQHISQQIPSQHPQDHQRKDKDAKANIVEIGPGGGALMAPPSSGLGPRMHRLSVSGGPGPGFLGSGGAPPGSPLLEAYRGTYQSISPMPSPIMLPSNMDDDDLSDITPLSGKESSDEGARPRGRGKEKVKEKEKEKKKRVKFYDPEKDAKELAEVLKHRNIEIDPLMEILPRLTHDHMMQLRTEYKKYAKFSGKGINIAKHIKLKLGTGAFGKACYVTALGRWESEAYWANFWYQSNTTRRELLIESLMGRTNAEIREIKEAFSDKRYNNSLEKCMKSELKADKFRVAVLLALEEKRQEESKYVYLEAVKDDVRRLHDALVAREGGETAMIHIVVTRSDTHMREVLKSYEKTYGKNFAKEMLRKSTNLVGETLAHILNGIINRPVRDALLLHQALNEESSNKERTDLLISRLVRYHWDRVHFEHVRTEFRARYGKELVTAVREGTKGDFGDFCTQLCLRRSTTSS
ncbi:MAG: hypothetical protein M1816_000834 [Peltula sp. TS41687]|nr:MAG: hypothetical protein M1816_000834 [Peltula sp. TS41687]